LKILFDSSIFLFLSGCQLYSFAMVQYFFKLDLYLSSWLIPIIVIVTLLIITVFYVSHFILKKIHQIKIINNLFDKSTLSSFFSELISLIMIILLVIW